MSRHLTVAVTFFCLHTHFLVKASVWIFQLVNNAIRKLVLFREKTEKVAEEEKLFKEKELEQLEKKIAEVKRAK